jgi:E3 ubiquitin-protein ligase DOA10
MTFYKLILSLLYFSDIFYSNLDLELFLITNYESLIEFVYSKSYYLLRVLLNRSSY